MLGYQEVADSPAPCSSSNGGAAGGPLTMAWVGPNRVGSSTDSYGTGHSSLRTWS
jgi:hypothetical protein